MKIILCLVLVATVIVAALTQNPPPPIWPLLWSAQWKLVYSNNASYINGGAWYYSAPTAQLRQDNQNHPKPGVTNSAIFAQNNMYWNIPDAGYCCLCWTNLRITEPGWLLNTNYSGQVSYSLVDPPVEATAWTWFADGSHIYYQSVSDALPVAESGWGTDLQWSNIKIDPIDPAVFELYDTGCLTRACPKDTFFCGNASDVSVNSFKDVYDRQVVKF